MNEVATTLLKKELLWLGCREKTCCHNTKVIVSGKDVWRISGALELSPWDFTLYAEAVEGAADGFLLAPEGPPYQVVLAKRGEVGTDGAPCIFLWKLADGHAQCGLGALRPMTCLTYPALVQDGLMRVESSACSCRRWSVLDVDEGRERALIGQMFSEAVEYVEMVADWNGMVAANGRERAYSEFCEWVLEAYNRRYGGRE